MKTKLIKNDLYLLLIDEEAEIKGGNELSFYKNNHGSEILCISYLSKTGVVFHELDVDPVEEYGSIEGGLTPLKEDISKIIAYYPLTKEAKELDLPLLPVTPRDKWGVHETHCCSKHGCKYGDNDCCVELGIAEQKYPCEFCSDEEQEFSLEDMKKAIEMARKTFPTEKLSCDRYSTEEIIQSLSTQQLPKEFIISDKFSTFEENIEYGKYIW